MDAKAFLKSIKSPRLQFIISYALKQKDWFDYQELYEETNKEALSRRKGIKKSKGYPSRTRNNILYLLRMGFFEAHPKLGLRVNKDFVPTSQK